MALELAEVQSFVSDLNAAREFYGDLLGLPLKQSSDQWLIFEVSGIDLILMGGAARHPERGEYGQEAATVLVLKSDDIEADYARLSARGVRFFSEVKTVPQGKYVGLQDPDGNLLELIQT